MYHITRGHLGRVRISKSQQGIHHMHLNKVDSATELSVGQRAVLICVGGGPRCARLKVGRRLRDFGCLARALGAARGDLRVEPRVVPGVEVLVARRSRLDLGNAVVGEGVDVARGAYDRHVGELELDNARRDQVREEVREKRERRREALDDAEKIKARLDVHHGALRDPGIVGVARLVHTAVPHHGRVGAMRKYALAHVLIKGFVNLHPRPTSWLGEIPGSMRQSSSPPPPPGEYIVGELSVEAHRRHAQRDGLAEEPKREGARAALDEIEEPIVRLPKPR